MADPKSSNNLVIRFTADIQKAEKQIERLQQKVRTMKDEMSKLSAFPYEKYGMEKVWGRAFGGFGMGSYGAFHSGRIDPTPKLPPSAIPEVNKQMGFFARIMDKFKSNLGITSIKTMTLGGSFNTLASSLLKLNPIIVGLTLGFGKLMERIFHYGNIIAQSKMVLTSVWGSERRAVEAIKGMREFSRRTQHSPEEVVGGTTMLAKYNVDPFAKGAYGLAKDKNVMNLMSGLAAMPGMGGQPIGLDRAINATIAGRDVRPLKALGPEVTEAYDKARQAGRSGTDPYIKVMLEELAKIPKIMALANAQADQLSTMWSTITGYAEEFFMDISGAGEEKGVVTLWSQMVDILRVIRDEGEKFVVFMGPFLMDFGAALGSVFKFVFDIVTVLGSVFLTVLAPAFKIVLQLVRVFFETMKFVFTLFIQLANLIISIVALPFKIIDALFGVSSKIEGILSYLEDFVMALQIIFMFLTIYIKGLFTSITETIDAFLKKNKDSIVKLTVAIMAMVVAWGIMKAPAFFSFLWTALKGIKLLTLSTRAWAAAQGLVNALMARNPVVLILLAVGALAWAITDLYQNWELHSLSAQKWMRDLITQFKYAKTELYSLMMAMGMVSKEETEAVSRDYIESFKKGKVLEIDLKRAEYKKRTGKDFVSPELDRARKYFDTSSAGNKKQTIVNDHRIYNIKTTKDEKTGNNLNIPMGVEGLFQPIYR
jgi:hypothetical protein